MCSAPHMHDCNGNATYGVETAACRGALLQFNCLKNALSVPSLQLTDPTPYVALYEG